MGIFDYFRSAKKQRTPIVKESVPSGEVASMPTVRPDDQIYACYDEVFKEMIAEISGITQREAAEIHRIINSCDGGFLNMHGYYSIVWENYFKGRRWQWEEYENWNAIFRKLGRFPSRFPLRNDAEAATISDALGKLTVGELKILCAEYQLAVPPKAKKKDLLEMLLAVPGIGASALVSSTMVQINDRFDYGLYSLFMRTMSFRANSLHTFLRRKNLGLTESTVVHMFEEDKEFVELALKMNPRALAPLFPGDMSSTKSILPF